MKYATLLFGTLLASIATAQAEPASIPTAYHGMWCNSDATPQKYKRCDGPENAPIADNGFYIGARVIAVGEFECSVLMVKRERDAIVVRFRGADVLAVPEQTIHMQLRGNLLLITDQKN